MLSYRKDSHEPVVREVSVGHVEEEALSCEQFLLRARNRSFGGWGKLDRHWSCRGRASEKEIRNQNVGVCDSFINLHFWGETRNTLGSLISFNNG